MRIYKLLGLLAIFLIAIGITGTAYSQATKEERHNPLHEQMDQMMDQMMGEGASHRMHEAMPGSEEMMELCTGTMSGGNQTSGMMGGMGGMMGPGMMGSGNPSQGMMGGMGNMMGMMQGMMGR